MTATIQVDIVSAEHAVFSGQALLVVVTGLLGELGIKPGHAPLLTTIRPGQIRLSLQNETEEIYYINGGVLEVQPNIVTILADQAIRAADIDEAKAVEAKQRAGKLLAEHKTDLDYSEVMAELAQAAAQIQAVNQLRRRLHR